MEKKKTMTNLFDEEDLYREFKKQLSQKEELIRDLRHEMQRDRNNKMASELVSH